MKDIKAQGTSALCSTFYIVNIENRSFGHCSAHGIINYLSAQQFMQVQRVRTYLERARAC